MFTEQEVNAIITAEQIVSKNKDKSLSDQYTDTIEKVKSVLKYAHKDKSELLSNRMPLRNNYEFKQTSDYLIQLQTAITNYQIVDLNYLSIQNKFSKRKIDPFALIHTQDNWILIVYCRLRADFRAFRLDCFQHVLKLNAHFEPHKITLQEYFEEKRKEWETTPDIPMSPPTTTFVSNKKNNKHEKSKH